MLGLWIIALLLIFGRITRLPGRVMWALVGLVWVTMLALQLTVPDSGIARIMGGNAAGWLVLGAVVGV
ncbi:MAG: hypothetical protein L0G27_11525, partial [Paracoccus sp. (in: a-proteobacteria)]|nr:hypothetical protein [Paracoccus sp. (in: a-proteobacteria)]